MKVGSFYLAKFSGRYKKILKKCEGISKSNPTTMCFRQEFLIEEFIWVEVFVLKVETEFSSQTARAKSVPLCLFQLDGQLHVLPSAPEKLDGIISVPSQKQIAGERRTMACRSPPLSSYTFGSAHKLAWKFLEEMEGKVKKVWTISAYTSAKQHLFKNSLRHFDEKFQRFGRKPWKVTNLLSYQSWNVNIHVRRILTMVQMV